MANDSAKKSNTLLVKVKEGAQILSENSLVRAGTAGAVILFCITSAWTIRGFMATQEGQIAEINQNLSSLTSSVGKMANEMEADRKDTRSEIREIRDRLARLEAKLENFR